MSTIRFKLKYTLNQRKAEAFKIRSKYSDRIPIIVEKRENDSLPNLVKTKYLAPDDMTIGQFVYVIRKKIELKPEQAIYLFINNKLPSTSALLSTVYDQDKDEDGFLYIQVASENTFGA